MPEKPEKNIFILEGVALELAVAEYYREYRLTGKYIEYQKLYRLKKKLEREALLNRK